MAICLTAEQQARLRAYVARNDFGSIEEAASQFIDERIAERALEEGDDLAWVKPDDLAWVKPYVDEAVEDMAQGNVLSRDEHRARNLSRLAALKG